MFIKFSHIQVNTADETYTVDLKNSHCSSDDSEIFENSLQKRFYLTLSKWGHSLDTTAPAGECGNLRLILSWFSGQDTVAINRTSECLISFHFREPPSLSLSLCFILLQSVSFGYHTPFIFVFSFFASPFLYLLHLRPLPTLHPPNETEEAHQNEIIQLHSWFLCLCGFGRLSRAFRVAICSVRPFADCFFVA